MNFSHLTLENLYHPTTLKIYSILSDISLVLTLLVAPSLIYAILTKSSTAMSFYKYMLVYEIFWCICLDVILAVWQPCMMIPFRLGYSIGPLSKIISPEFQYHLIPVLVITLLGMAQGVYIAFMYRSVWFFNFKWTLWAQDLAKSGKFMIFCYVSTFIGVIGILAGKKKFKF